MSRWILAIDQGTTNTKALLIDAAGQITARASHPVAISFPQPGWVEQDAWAIWDSVQRAVEACLDGRKPAAIGISNQRESVLAWDARSGEPLGPAINWQCRRTSPFCASLRARNLAPWLEEKTGLTIDPLFSASKARWLLDHIPDGRARAANGDVRLGTVDSWLIWRLSNGAVHATDASNAARTQLVGLARGDWDQELLELFEIPRAALPRIQATSSVFTEADAFAGAVVASAAGDSHAALFGHAAFQPGAVKATYGTGSSLMALERKCSGRAPGLSRTIAWRIGDQPSYAIEGNIASTGATVEWLGALLSASNAAEVVADLASKTDDNGGVYLVPAFAGLGAPHWDDAARGLICGMTRATEARHLARAAIESIAYQIHDVFEAIEAPFGGALTALLADGGASRNDALMQFQADILDRPVLRNTSADLSGLGAALLAGLTIGMWNDLAAIEKLPRTIDRFTPHMDAARRTALLGGWRDALARTSLRPSAGAC